MRIVELRSKNVKRLSAVHVMADESVNVIGGKNGAGKSSVLDSIVYALLRVADFAAGSDSLA